MRRGRWSSTGDGAGTAVAPASGGPGALTGPSTATSRLLNPTIPEPLSTLLCAAGLATLGLSVRRRRLG